MVWHNQSCHVAARDNATETINSWCGVGSLDAASPRPSFASDEGEGEKVMGTKKDEILAIAREQGYEGAEPSTISDAINALGTVAGGGGGGGMVVNIIRDNSTGDLVPDKSFDEIKDYIDAGGRDVVVYYDPSSLGYSIKLYHLATWNFMGSGSIGFVNTAGGSGIQSDDIIIYPSNVSTGSTFISDSSPYKVSFSRSGDTYTANKTNSEITNAYGNDKVVFGSSSGLVWHLVYSYGGAPYFATVDTTASQMSVKVLTPSSSSSSNKTYTVQTIAAAS